MSTNDFVVGIEATIRRALESRIQEAKDRALNIARTDFETSLRKILADVSLQVANYYSVERLGSELLIRVQLEPSDSTL